MPSPWSRLFSDAQPAPGAALRLEMLVLKKGGQPLLVVPRGYPAATTALTLYPAQTWRARLAKALWRQALHWGIPAGMERDTLTLDPQDPFLEFLRVEEAHPANTPTPHPSHPSPPAFALLAGNPRTPGRRFLLLVFGPDHRPAAVVKAGTEPAAHALIDKEASFLASVRPGWPGLPTLRQTFRSGSRSALALDYIDGETPPPGQNERLAPLLDAWLDKHQQVPLTDLAQWRQLAQASVGDDLFVRLARQLAGLTVHPALFHGDLAPWNIKASPTDGSWTVLDWERGDGRGVPGWDWFHYVLQPALLVQKQSPAALVHTAQALLDSAPFRRYAQAAGLTGHERSWLLAYLLHCRDVLRPSEGRDRLGGLLSLLAQSTPPT